MINLECKSATFVVMSVYRDFSFFAICFTITPSKVKLPTKKSISRHPSKCTLEGGLIKESSKSTFQVSGSPGRHQWLQSAYVSGCRCCSVVNGFPSLVIVYTDGCASIRSSERWVIFRYVTGVLMLLMFLSTMVTRLFGNPGATVPAEIGNVWL